MFESRLPQEHRSTVFRKTDSTSNLILKMGDTCNIPLKSLSILPGVSLDRGLTLGHVGPQPRPSHAECTLSPYDAKRMTTGPDDKAADTGQRRLWNSLPQKVTVLKTTFMLQVCYHKQKITTDPVGVKGIISLTSVPPSCNASAMEELVGDSLTLVCRTAHVTYTMFHGRLP